MESSEDTYELLVDDLLELYPPRDCQLGFRESHLQAGALAHGWMMRCIRSVRATILLSKHGFSFEAAPLRRTIIEHATGLAWLAVEGNRVAQSVIRLNANQAQTRLGAANEAGWTRISKGTFEEAQADGEATERVGIELDVSWTFRNRNARYGSPNYLPVWETETAHSKPSWTSASPYVVEESNGHISLLVDPVEAPLDPFAAIAPPLADALVAVNYMLEGFPLTDELRSLIRRAYELDTRALARRGMDRPPEYDEPILPDLP